MAQYLPYKKPNSASNKMQILMILLLPQSCLSVKNICFFGFIFFLTLSSLVSILSILHRYFLQPLFFLEACSVNYRDRYMMLAIAIR